MHVCASVQAARAREESAEEALQSVLKEQEAELTMLRVGVWARKRGGGRRYFFGMWKGTTQPLTHALPRTRTRTQAAIAEQQAARRASEREASKAIEAVVENARAMEEGLRAELAGARADLEAERKQQVRVVGVGGGKGVCGCMSVEAPMPLT
jgi:hypothetical protein